MVNEQGPGRDAGDEGVSREVPARRDAHRDLVSLSVSVRLGEPVVTFSGAGPSDVSLEEALARLDALERAVEELEAENRSLRTRVEGLMLREERNGLEPRGEVTEEQAQLEVDPGTPRPGERPAKDALIDAWLEAVARERGEAQGDAEDENVKPMTLYLSEQTRRLLSIGKALGVGSMSEQVDALVRERMRGREGAELHGDARELPPRPVLFDPEGVLGDG